MGNFINSITNSNFVKGARKKASELCTSVGRKINNNFEKSPNKDTFLRKFINTYEPNEANNSFAGMATLMGATVVIPRVLTAAKRNPNDKEATKDEITEILFRDIQTILIILFALKSMNAAVSNIASKKSGLPMTNRAYKAVFETQEKGLNGIKEKTQEFLAHPIQKLGIIGKNIIDTLNPTGGVKALTKEQYASKYTSFETIDEVTKLFDDIANFGGNGKNEKGANKVFNNLMDNLIATQDRTIKNQANLVNSGVIETISDKPQKIKEALEKLREVGVSGLKDENLDENVQKQIVEYFKDSNNKIANKAYGIDAILKTLAIGIECAYLGFGLPALNQKRLERKYLNKETSFKGSETQQQGFNPLVDKNIKAQEVKIFHNFIK